MKRLLFFLLISASFAQGLKAQRMLVLPDTPMFANQNRGVWVFRIADGLPYYSNGTRWIANTGGLGPQAIRDSLLAYDSRNVTSYNGIRGAVKGVDSIWFTNLGTVLNWRFNNITYSQSVSGGSGVPDSTVFATINFVVSNFASLLSLNGKVNISDTGTMLVPYLRKVDTTGRWVTNAIVRNDSVFFIKNGSENFLFQLTATSVTWGAITGTLSAQTDLQSALNGKQATLVSGTNLKTVNGNSLLGAGDISISGGGGGDSSWLSTTTGGEISDYVGYLVNTNFPGSSLPSGFTDVTPSATVTVADKLIVSGGTTTTGSAIGNTGSSVIYSNRLDLDYFPYEKIRYNMTVVPQNKDASSNGLVLDFKANSLFFSFSTSVRFDLSSNADSGKVIISNGLSTLLTSSTSLPFNPGDTLLFEIIRDYWQLRAKMFNKSTGKAVIASYVFSNGFGTGGQAYIGLLGGTQHITNFSVYSFNRKSTGFTLIGDSHTSGAGATSEEKSFASILFKGDETRYSNLGHGSVTLAAQVTSHLPAAILLNNPVIITAGYNDRRDLTSDTNTYRQRLDSIVQPLLRAGLKVYLTTLVPIANGVANNNFNTTILNLGSTYNLPVVRVDTVLRISAANFYIKPQYISNDGVHMSDSGHYVYSQELYKVLGTEIETLFKKDSVSPLQFTNVPAGYDPMAHLVMDNRGYVYQQPYRPFNGIKNSFTENAKGTVAQKNSEVHISGPLKSDSALLIHSKQGLKIGFNGGDGYGTTNVGTTNINITNVGVSGLGYPQVFDNMTGNGNIKIWVSNPNRTITSAGGTISGGSNLILNSHGNSTLSGSWNNLFNTNALPLTTGAYNIMMGQEAGKGITTGSENIHLYTRATLAPTFSTSLSNTLYLGDFSELGNAIWNTPAAGQVSISASRSVANTFLFGGPVGLGGLTFAARSRTNSADLNGWDWDFYSSKGTGTGTGGTYRFYTWNSRTSGSDLHNVSSLELSINNKRIIVENRFQTSTGANVASANDLTLGNDGNVFTITGTTQINAITTTNWQAGSEIILIFTGAVTVKNNTSGGANTAVIRLSGGVDFSATADDVLKLVYNGTAWFEVSRSVN